MEPLVKRVHLQDSCSIALISDMCLSRSITACLGVQTLALNSLFIASQEALWSIVPTFFETIKNPFRMLNGIFLSRAEKVLETQIPAKLQIVGWLPREFPKIVLDSSSPCTNSDVKICLHCPALFYTAATICARLDSVRWPEGAPLLIDYGTLKNSVFGISTRGC